MSRGGRLVFSLAATAAIAVALGTELRYFPATKVAVALQLNRDFGVNSDALVIEIARRVRDGSQR